MCYANLIFTQSSLLNNTDSLDNYVHKHLSSFELPGLAIGIIKDGVVYYQKGYGVQSLGGNTPIDIHTLFPIASVTKTFTGILLSSLLSEKGISINEPVNKFLPGFHSLYEPYKSELSLADVLSHRSGWKTFQGDFLNTESTLSDSQLVNRLNYLKPVYPLRTKFGYSNMGFLLAGLTVNNIAGSSFAEQLKTRILDPLQMHNSFTDSIAVKNYLHKTSLHSQAQNKIIETRAKFEAPRGYGGMYSTVSDLSLWMQMLLDSGRYKKRQIIPYKAIEQSFNSYSIIGKQTAGNRKKYLKTYGLGWEIIQYEGVEIVQHGGAYAGSLSMLAMIPSLKFGIVILTNGDFHPLQETLKWQLIDALLQIPSQDYTNAALIRRNQRLEQTTSDKNLSNSNDSVINIPELLIKSLEGQYSCEAYGNAWIKKINNKLILQLEHHPSVSGELIYKGNKVFECRYSHAMFGKQNFLFHINEKGISGFDLSVDPFIEDAVYTFQKN
jgi:CubicO group peptidase (beta-lactamase class C family)